jgi:hypothetical protein
LLLPGLSVDFGVQQQFSRCRLDFSAQMVTRGRRQNDANIRYFDGCATIFSKATPGLLADIAIDTFQLPAFSFTTDNRQTPNDST